MVLAQSIINIIYYIFAGIIGLCLLLKLFKRNKREGIVYDIVYAYCIIPFLLRILYIK